MVYQRARQNAVLVQGLHPVAEQNIAVEIRRAHRGEDIMQIQRERRVRDTPAKMVQFGQIDICPAGILRDPVHKNIKPRAAAPSPIAWSGSTAVTATSWPNSR